MLRTLPLSYSLVSFEIMPWKYVVSERDGGKLCDQSKYIYLRNRTVDDERHEKCKKMKKFRSRLPVTTVGDEIISYAEIRNWIRNHYLKYFSGFSTIVRILRKLITIASEVIFKTLRTVYRDIRSTTQAGRDPRALIVFFAIRFVRMIRITDQFLGKYSYLFCRVF